ncbi:hypothetical protein Tcan_09477 [Toxocara canis]|uniref:Receptor ligand binding region domain-containing protein n=1 Tax=Toxocara canis TaxID=6265 RepID=A0A0B2VE66_TOXCA|nr:hypothetical protein Tcan_09477 [Toxocara canis]
MAQTSNFVQLQTSNESKQCVDMFNGEHLLSYIAPNGCNKRKTETSMQLSQHRCADMQRKVTDSEAPDGEEADEPIRYSRLDGIPADEMRVAAIAQLALLLTVAAQLRLGVIETDQALVRLCQIAIDHATAAGSCTQEIRLFNASGCGSTMSSKGTANAAAFYFESQIQAIIGPHCNEELMQTGRLSYFWDVPVLARLASDPRIADTLFYPTVVQYAITSAAGLSYALKQFADYMNLTESFAMRCYALYENIFFFREWIETTCLIAIGTDFVDLRNVLNSLKVVSLSSENFIIVLLCSRVSTSCISQIVNLVYSASIIVLAPDIQNRDAIAEKLGRLLPNLINYDRLEDYVTMYNACYGFCFGTKTSSTGGIEYARNMQNKQFTGLHLSRGC